MEIAFVISLVSVIITICKQAFEKPVSKDRYFDWDLYYKDAENGISATEQLKRRQNGYYYKYRESTSEESED